MSKIKAFIIESTETEDREQNIYSGREKMSQDEVVAKYGDGVVHVDEMAISRSKDGNEYAVIHITEEPLKFINCGKVMTDIVKRVRPLYNSWADLNTDLAYEPLEFKISATKSNKTGRTYFKWSPAWL